MCILMYLNFVLLFLKKDLIQIHVQLIKIYSCIEYISSLLAQACNVMNTIKTDHVKNIQIIIIQLLLLYHYYYTILLNNIFQNAGSSPFFRINM